MIYYVKSTTHPRSYICDIKTHMWTGWSDSTTFKSWSTLDRMMMGAEYHGDTKKFESSHYKQHYKYLGTTLEEAKINYPEIFI